MAFDNEKFKSVDELYVRILPALNTKVSELKRMKINNIKESDVWKYCIKVLWNDKKDLRLYKMVDDILNIDVLDIIDFQKNIMRDNNE